MHSSKEIQEFIEGPKTEQLFDLAAALMYTARNQGRLKKSKKGDNSRWFYGDKEFDDLNLDDDFGYTSKATVGRLSRTGNGLAKKWNMRIVERFHAIGFEQVTIGDEEINRANGDASRVVYSFEWTSSSVLKAVRKITATTDEEAASSPHEELLIPDLDDVSMSPDMWNASFELGKISRADCRVLLKNVRESARTNNLFAGPRE